MKIVKNEVTNQPEFLLKVKVLQIGTSVRKNSNETEYRLATAELLEGPKKGSKVTVQIWEKLVENVQVKEEYDCTASIMDDGAVLFTLRPFITGEKLTVEDFGITVNPKAKTLEAKYAFAE